MKETTTVVRCDMCQRVIAPGEKIFEISTRFDPKARDYDLCRGCADRLKDFLCGITQETSGDVFRRESVSMPPPVAPPPSGPGEPYDNPPPRV